MRHKCHIESDGTLIPRCLGVAAACGCGKTDAEILSCCTCPETELVRASIVSPIACPGCGVQLRVEPVAEFPRLDLREATLDCEKCERRFRAPTIELEELE